MENKTSCKSLFEKIKMLFPVLRTAESRNLPLPYSYEENPRQKLSGMTSICREEFPDRITRGATNFKGGGPGLRPSGATLRGGFTLIELLVVVLIIGILASIALPQYQKAVEKSKAAQALTVLNSYYQAYQAYYMSEGSAPGTLDVLPVNMPWSGTEVWASTNPVGKAVSNEDWAVQIYTNSDGFAGMCAGRLRGEYKGAGFCKFRLSPREDIKPDELYCAEKKNGHGILFQKSKGDYCKNIIGGTYVGFSTFYFFSLP